MSGRFLLSPRARRDFDEIWTHTEAHWGTEQAETYIRQIGQHLARLAANPGLGRACPEIRAGYSKYPSGSHLVFYRRVEGGIDVVRILHARMDIGGQF